jgi:uncharacterized protein (TIGR02996 family)
MRTFELVDDTSRKFWIVELAGKSFTVTFGRLGSDGQKQVKKFPSEAAARKEHDKLIGEKLRKGYRETTPVPKKAPSSLRESLEQALVDDPDDLGNHMAHADYLNEQGDPLGEFIRIQLSLEDATKPAEERKALQQQEAKLLKKHGPEWLGDLAPYLLQKKKKSDPGVHVKYTFRRGWLDDLEAHSFTVDFTRALARSPATRLLRRLQLDDNAYEEEGEYEPGDDLPADDYFPQLHPLLRSPYLTNVRTFILGEFVTPDEEDEADDGAISCHTEGQAAVGLVKLMPKLEELYLLGHGVDTVQLFSLKTLTELRVLMVYHNNSYPLARLANNPSLGKLTQLLCHPHALDDEYAYIREPAVKALVNATNLPSLTHLRLRLSDMGDKGMKTIVASGILKRLKMLDLRHGRVSDVGARTLAGCPDLKNLELLDLTNNALTEEGIEVLKATGVNLVAESQWELGTTAGEWGDGEEDYLYAGDIE